MVLIVCLNVGLSAALPIDLYSSGGRNKSLSFHWHRVIEARKLPHHELELIMKQRVTKLRREADLDVVTNRRECFMHADRLLISRQSEGDDGSSSDLPLSISTNKRVNFLVAEHTREKRICFYFCFALFCVFVFGSMVGFCLFDCLFSFFFLCLLQEGEGGGGGGKG